MIHEDRHRRGPDLPVPWDTGGAPVKSPRATACLRFSAGASPRPPVEAATTIAPAAAATAIKDVPAPWCRPSERMLATFSGPVTLVDGRILSGVPAATDRLVDGCLGDRRVQRARRAVRVRTSRTGSGRARDSYRAAPWLHNLAGCVRDDERRCPASENIRSRQHGDQGTTYFEHPMLRAPLRWSVIHHPRPAICSNAIVTLLARARRQPQPLRFEARWITERLSAVIDFRQSRARPVRAQSVGAIGRRS